MKIDASVQLIGFVNSLWLLTDTSLRVRVNNGETFTRERDDLNSADEFKL